VNKLFDFYISKGKIMDEIALLINMKNYRVKKWSSRTISTVIRNPIYAGYHRFKDLTYKGTHDPIISIEKYNKACEILNSRGGRVELIIKGIE